MRRRRKKLRERQRAHRLIRRCIRFLKEAYGWKIQFLPIGSDRKARRRLGQNEKEAFVGLYFEDRKTIVIDPSHRDFFGVLLHECLHGVLPKAPEKEILELEQLTRRHITPRQAEMLLKAVAFRLK